MNKVETLTPELRSAVSLDRSFGQSKGPLPISLGVPWLGIALHRILEQIPFQAAEADDPSLLDRSKLDRSELDSLREAVIDAELRRAGLDCNLQSMVMEGLDYVLKTPLGGPLEQLQLSQLGLKQRIHELSFDLPVGHVRTKDLVQAFRCSPNARLWRAIYRSPRHVGGE
jgi:exodeoxyribonuclease V beta subunit